MKRSKQIVLLLSGSLLSASFGGCGGNKNGVDDLPLSVENVYTNNQYTSGAGFYHAPYCGWYAYPYNYYEPGRGYFHGGNWTMTPHDSPLYVSRPSSAAVASAKSSYASTRRGGFGSFHSTSS